MDEGSVDPLLGRTLASRFTLEALLGAGAMGRVYRARDAESGGLAAIKVLHAHVAAEPSHRKRFLNEARAVARVSHPSVVSLLDVGAEGDGIAWIAMELLDGPTLSALLLRDGPLSFERTAELGLQCLEALEVVHAAEILHRDLKPENMVLARTEDGGERVKLTDFGLAKILSDVGGAKLTATGTVAGSPAYLSPEQCRGAPVDARSDLYMLAVSLYELCTGRLPFSEREPMAMLLAHITEAPTRPREWAPELPVAFEEWLLRSLSKAPAKRFPSARAMADALRALLAPDPRATLEAPPQDAPPAQEATASVPATQTEARRTGSRTLLPVVVLGALGLATIPVFLAGRSSPRIAPTTQPARPRPPAPTPSPPSRDLVPPLALPEPVPPTEAPPTEPLPPQPEPTARTPRRRDRGADPAAIAPVDVPTPIAPEPVAPPPAPAVEVPPPPPPPPAPTPAAVAPRAVRAVEVRAGEVQVGAGAARAPLQQRASRAAQAFAACLTREAIARGETPWSSPERPSVAVTVRDRRFDEARRGGGPSWFARCDGAWSEGFAGELPEAEDLEYLVRFTLTVTAVP